MVVFGMGLLNGAKMSSSKGNVFLLEDAVSEFGADTVRMFLMGSAEPWQDFDWRNELVLSTKKQIERFYYITELKGAQGEPHDIDRWLIEPAPGTHRKDDRALETSRPGQALQEASFGIETDLKWYRRGCPKAAMAAGNSRPLLGLGPAPLAVCPVHGRTPLEGNGQQGPVSFAPWPVADEHLINTRIELAEELLAARSRTLSRSGNSSRLRPNRFRSSLPGMET